MSLGKFLSTPTCYFWLLLYSRGAVTAGSFTCLAWRRSLSQAEKGGTRGTGCRRGNTFTPMGSLEYPGNQTCMFWGGKDPTPPLVQECTPQHYPVPSVFTKQSHTDWDGVLRGNSGFLPKNNLTSSRGEPQIYKLDLIHITSFCKDMKITNH